ncbi:MAG: hypothetical protein ABJL67_09395 [Sulfitobacter sp.]
MERQKTVALPVRWQHNVASSMGKNAILQWIVGELVKQAKMLTDAELKRVLAGCVTMRNGKRNRLMVMLCHYAGTRVGGIASLK